MRTFATRAIPLTLVLWVFTGCLTHQAYRKAEVAAQQGNWDEAVLYYLKATEDDPSDIGYRAALLRAKIKASQAHVQKGQEFEKANVVERALVEYQQAVQLDPTNQFAEALLEKAHRAYLVQRRDPETIEQMKAKTRGALPQPPVLNPRSNTPISLDFPQPVSIFQIYRALGEAFGINVLFDPNLRDTEIAVNLKDVTAQSSLETLMRTAGHFYKVMDEHSIIIAADTPQNRRTYEDLVIQTFFLSNAEMKEVLTSLRSLIDARKIATNEQLNAIILRDTADKVKVAEKIIQANDKAKAEVVVDVELLQINTARLRDLGVSLSSYSIGQRLDLGGSTGGDSSSGANVRLSDLQFINQSNWILNLPNFVYNFVKTNTDAQLLAKPQLRITDGEKASLVIGDRVPIPLTTFNTQNAGGAGGVVPITSFQYQDVGIRIDMEPRVHHNREITLKIKVEVSNVNGNVQGSGGQSQPIIGTRTIDSTIRLQDGETNFLAGLIRTDEQNSDSGIPGLSEIPLLGRLFSNRHTEGQRSDVILTITPHIIRNAQITEEDLLPIWVGTEQNISFRGGSPRVESDVEGPFDTGEGTPEEIQEAIRRRLEQLPRGLRPGEEGEEGVIEEQPQVDPNQQQQQPPPGVNLVPVAPPADIFKPGEPTPPADAPPPPNAALGGLPEGATTTLAKGRFRLASLGSESAAPLGGAAGEVEESETDKAARTPAVKLWLTPARLTIAPGEVFEVRIQADARAPVSHLPFSLDWDPALLAVEKVEAGDFLGGTNESQVLSDGKRLGSLVVGASRLGKIPGVTGNGTVVRITFKALGAGNAAIGFNTSAALNPSLQPMVLRTRPALVEISGEGEPPAARPEHPVKQGVALSASKATR